MIVAESLTRLRAKIPRIMTGCFARPVSFQSSRPNVVSSGVFEYVFLPLSSDHANTTWFVTEKLSGLMAPMKFDGTSPLGEGAE